MISEPPNIFGTVYGFDDYGPIRFSDEGEDRTFAEPVRFCEMRCWDPARVHVSAGSEQQCVFYGYLEDDDTATVLMYEIRCGIWSTPIRMKRPESWQPKALPEGYAGPEERKYLHSLFIDVDALERDR